jgi:cytochrome P450
MSHLPKETYEQVAGLTQWLDRIIMFQDPPYHTRVRSIVSRAFTSRSLANKTSLIDQVTRQILERLLPSGRMELMADFAEPLPGTVIATLLGVPAADWPRLRRMSYDLTSFVTPDPRRVSTAVDAYQSWCQMVDYMRRIVQEKRTEPREDIISGLVQARDAGEFADDDELLASCCMLMSGGVETSSMLIVNGMLALLRQPDRLIELRQQPELVDRAVQEFLRFDSPTQMMSRLACEPMELGGQRIEKGQRVFLLIGSANRDEAQWEDPDKLRFDRPGWPHLAFGAGAHFCVGSPLARIELEIAFRALVSRLDDIQLAPEPIRWRERNMAFRCPDQLYMTFRPSIPTRGS